jgi:hypothetical protein
MPEVESSPVSIIQITTVGLSNLRCLARFVFKSAPGTYRLAMLFFHGAARNVNFVYYKKT